MANILNDISEVCWTNIEDVRDSLCSGCPEFCDETNENYLSDEDVIKYIIDAQELIKAYLKSINANPDCYTWECDEVPVKLQQLTIKTIKVLWKADNVETKDDFVSNMEPGDSFSQTVCGVTQKYSKGCCGLTSGDFIDECLAILPCSVTNALNCCRQIGFSRNTIPDMTCSCGIWNGRKVDCDCEIISCCKPKNNCPCFQ